MRITAVDTFIIDVPQNYPVAPYQSRYVATSRTGALLVRRMVGRENRESARLKKGYSLREVRRFAHAWADSERRGCRGLGYPSATAISRLITSPGRSTRRNIAPDYEPCAIAQRFKDALREIDNNQQRLIYCRFVDGVSDEGLLKIDKSLISRHQARRAIDRALRLVGKAL